MSASLTQPEWPSFAAWAESIRPDDARSALAGITHAWCLIRSLGPIERDRPVSFGVTMAHPFGHADLIVTHRPDEYRRWDGYRYLAIGAMVPSTDSLQHGAPYWELVNNQTGHPAVTVLLIAQWAAAELCATFAQAVWHQSIGRIDYLTRTFGRPSTRREALLAQRGQDLIAVMPQRGRPLETPLRALRRLSDASKHLSPRDVKGRRNLAAKTMLSPEGIDKLRQRTLFGRLSDAVNADEFRRISAVGNLVQTGAAPAE